MTHCICEYFATSIMTNILSYQDAISYDALCKSMNRCKRNVQWKDSAANYVLHSVKNNSSLAEELADGTYKQREPYLFKIYSPKPREILSVPFRDRIYQRSLNDNILYPAMTQCFILDNCACQNGKGNQFARVRLVKQLRKAVNKNGTNLFVLQIDIHGFYKHLTHEYVEGLFKKRLDEETFIHVKAIMEKQYIGEVGFNPGSQMIQIAGVSALNGLDHYIKEQLHVAYYEHYMDDLLLIVESEEKAKLCKTEIARELSEIGLEFNKRKTHICKVTDGIDFLGFKFVVTKTGKVVQYPLPSKIKNAKRKYKRMVTHTFPAGKIKIESIEESYKDFRACISEGDSYYSLQRMDKYYLSLWKGTDYEQREIQFIANLRAKKARNSSRKSFSR